MTNEAYHGVMRSGSVSLPGGAWQAGGPLMPAALLDTNAISDLMRDHPQVKARIGKAGSRSSG